MSDQDFRDALEKLNRVFPPTQPVRPETLRQIFGITPVASHIRGLTEPGNIDLYNRPRVRNADGSISTVRSLSFNVDGREILIPTVVGNRVVSDEEAIQHYYRTGEHLGVFASPETATEYADRLHQEYAAGKYDKPK